MLRSSFRSRWFWSVALLSVAVIQFAHRTPPIRVDSFFFDFSNVYSASRTWLQGHDAYNLHVVYRTWDQSDHGPFLGTTREAGMHTWAAVYPPSSLLMFAPFAALTAVPAHVLWMIASVALLGLTFPAVIELAGIRSWSLRVLLVAASLASAPVQCALGSGQPALPACALLILAVWAYSRGQLTLAGVLLGLAAAVKIQIGGPFIVYYLFLRQWKIASTAAMLFCALTLIAVVRLEAAGVENWATDWRQNVAATLEPGGINDPRPNGPFRNDMINLQTLLHVPVQGDSAVNFGVMLVFLPIVTAFFGLVRPSRHAGADLLKLSMVGLLSMLPLYHRLYDSVLLIMLLAWALGNLDGKHRAVAIAALALMGELLIPIDLTPAILRRTHWFDGAVNSAWWQGVVVPHHAWGIVSLAIGGLFLLWRMQAPISLPALLPPPIGTNPSA